MQEEWCCKHHELHHQREQHDLTDRAPEAGHFRPELCDVELALLDLRLEALRTQQVERDSGPRARDVSFAEHNCAASGIMDVVAPAANAAGDRRQHHEVVEVPVQDCRHVQMRQVLDLAPQRPRVEPDVLGDLHHLLEVSSFQAHAVALPQGDEVGRVPVEPCYHGKAGKGTFAGLTLRDVGCLLPPGKLYKVERAVHEVRFNTALRGCRSQARKV